MTVKQPNSPHSLPTHIFFWRLLRSMFYGFFLIGFSLMLGMIGYHQIEKMSWIDAYANASMILSGMGPLEPLKTDAGKIFAGTYALFSGVIFLVIIAVIFAPVVHHFLHKFHMDDDKDK